MGSSCCRNVRVTGIPYEEPTKVNNVEEQHKPSVFPSSPPVPTEFDNEKTNSQSTTMHLPLPLNSINPDEKDKTSAPFRLPNLSNEHELTNDNKRVTSSKLPPIRQPKNNSESDQQLSNRRFKPLSRRTHIEEERHPIGATRLPIPRKPIVVENNDNLVQSVSEKSDSNNDDKLDDDWRSLKIPDRTDFYDDDRFVTSTPIPPSPEQSDSDEEHVVTLNHLLRPSLNHIGSNEKHRTVPLTILQILRLREQMSVDECFNPISIPDLKLSSQHLYSTTDQVNSSVTDMEEVDNDEIINNSFEGPTIYLSDTLTVTDNNINPPSKIDLVHPEAFDEAFILKRQHVIENSSYRIIIEGWRPNSIEQLVDHIKTFSKNKPIIDRLWMVFYWIARNIEYDTVPYVGKKHVDKSAEAVFRTKKAINDGYANIFKRLCNDLDLTCEKIHGHSKAYVFDSCNKLSVPIDHMWNAVQINQYWYLVDLTLSAGYLDDNQVFKRELNSYYFLSRSNEMIYHHFPADERWQLLQQPIKMSQYMQMPKLWPKFFQLDLQLISPRDIIHVDLVSRQSYAIVLIQAPRNVSLAANFTLNEKEVDGGQRITLDTRKRIYRCYFAPTSIGVHIIHIFAKEDSVTDDLYDDVIELELDIRQIPSKRISFPQTWKPFLDLNLEIIWPCNKHLIKMNHGDTHTEILIRAPADVELVGQLTVDNNVKIPGGQCTFIDRRKGVWRCMFAPHCDGLFETYIMAKRRLDPGSFAIAARFRIKARRIPLPPLSYPKTWQLFHDLDLHVEIPRNSATVIWPEYSSYAQVCIRTPTDVRLMCCIEYNGVRVENGSLTQFNSEKQHWQLLFAPERTGEHKLLIFAHCSTPDGIVSGIAVEFQLNVTQLRHSIKFPVIYTTFLTKKCRIHEPIDGMLKKGAVVCIHCEIPNARQVDLTIDSKWVKTEGYQNSILKRQIIAGSREVIIYAKYDENTIYNELIKYTVQ
jgi:hypothetical protein